MSHKTLADALIAAKVVPPDMHPDVVFARQLVKGWVKAIRWLEKQPQKYALSMYEVVDGRKPDPEKPRYAIPTYLAGNRVRMVAWAFRCGFRGVPESKKEPYLGDILASLAGVSTEDRDAITKEVEAAFQRWISRKEQTDAA